MNRKISIITFIIVFIVVGTLGAFIRVGETQAQIDAFTFFIPYRSDQVDDMLDAGSNVNFANQAIRTTVNIISARNGVIIYYDHWEDGYEDNITSPTQASTLIWGDGNPANGFPTGIPTDIINADTIIKEENTIAQPRPAGNFFDGGDKLTAVGGNIAVSIANWEDGGLGAGIFYAGSWELYPTSRWGTGYTIPIGEDAAGLRAGFGRVMVNAQAIMDATTVELDLDADGTFETTEVLNQGQQLSAIFRVANSGAHIRSTDPLKPIQVHLFASDPVQTYESRAYTISPLNDWVTDYLAPRSSDGDYLLYNPNATPLTVNVTTVGGLVTPIIIPANGVGRFPPAGAPPPPLLASGLLAPTGARFTSTGGSFYGLAALDPNSARDWGYSIFPVPKLSSQELIGWAPGNANNTAGFNSRLYVTANTATTISADFNNDGVVDQTYPVAPQQEVEITNTINPLTLSGTFLFTADGTPFATVWGQDRTAPPGFPSLDIGTAIVPLASLSLQKSVERVVDADGTGTTTWGDTVRFKITLINNSNTIITPTTVSDNLNSFLTYVPNSTQVRGASVPDNTTGNIFPLDPGLVVGLAAKEAISITFDTTINKGAGAVANTASASAPGFPPADAATISIPLKVADYEFDKRLISPANGQANRGDVITYGVTITSTGNISITKLPLRDSFDESQLTFISATPNHSITSTGAITWDDLTALLGPLTPNRTIFITITSKVDNVSPDTTTIQNTASVEGAQGADGSPLPKKMDTAQVTVPKLVSSYTFNKRLIDPATGQSAYGNNVSFGLTITNTGNLSITALTLRDTVNPAHLTFLNSTPSANDTSTPGTALWNTLATGANPLLPGQTINITVTYQALAGGQTSTTNVAGVEGVKDSLGRDLGPLTGSATVQFTPPPAPPPPPAPAPAGPSDDDDDDDGSRGSPPPAAPAPAAPQPTPTPTPGPALALAPGAAAPTPTLPVTLLPETGVRDSGTGFIFLAVLALVGSFAMLIVWSKSRGRSKQ